MAHHSLRNHRKLKRLRHLLPSTHVAQLIGHLELLWWSAYESPSVTPNGLLMDWTTEDLEACSEWDGERGVFAQALIDTGFIDKEDGFYSIHDYADWAPRYVKQRWQRERSRVSGGHTTGAHERTTAHYPTQPNPTQPKTTKKTSIDPSVGKPRTGGNELTRLWDRLFETKFQNGRYPWQAKDAIGLAKVSKAVGGGLPELERVIVRYLECQEPFFTGHPIGKLLSQLPKFTAKTEFELSWEKAE